ncbi:uncharacterized protein LOC109714584 [Ananas comosus]|uniref:Uncharacterized protein LOC109713692 isoform X2 n=1 Tax=Ananas comosus TaxID=4615 RepID=A0A6P5FJ56_ANACO|nr:uncharacterized protein LOC109713692 isoform X2 [Ananas comosus]XP_020094870.1 uncharacterized protein LOC109714584 [Ananas comosus]
MAEGGLVVANNETIRSFLLSAATRCGGGGGGSLGAELRDLASYLSSQSSVPYRSLRAIWFAIPAAERPPLRRLFNGADFVFSSPKPREKSEELKERLKKLAEMAERREYAELVKDVAPKKEISEPFSSYKDQIGFGLHVVLMMFTGYLVGYAAFRALFNHSAVMNAAGGILGLVCGMLLETVLFIIRTSNRDLDSSNSNSRLKKHQ